MLQLGREGLDIRAANRGAVKAGECLDITDRFYLLAQTLRDAVEADLQGLQDVLLLGEYEA